MAHVRFLSQPALKGRKPGSLGSWEGRRYIEERFKAAGLVPWGEKKDFVLPFGYGKNVVGVLPGSDAALAKEIVLVSAHYDHLGKDHKGRICPGAADNAAGVAALLEIARQLSEQKPRPKRSVAFAAFDCEEMMLFGSFAFTCRKDVQGAKIVAVVNADMLGRDLLDVVTNTVFVAGTEGYAGLGEHVCQFGNEAGIRVLPLGTDLIGPRSDHVAFQSRRVPCLFFSCGTCKDYHEPTDTADKLNFGDIEHSADVMRRTVLELANAPIPELSTKSPDQGTGSASEPMVEELRSVCTLMRDVGEHREQAGIRKEDAEAFQKVALEAQELLQQGRYDREARAQLIVDATGTLVPYFMPTEPGQKASERNEEMRLAMQSLQVFYLTYGPQLMEGYRGLVAQLLKYNPGPIHGMPKFEYGIYDIPEDGISLKNKGDGRYGLNVMINRFSINAQTKPTKWLLKSFQVYLVGFFDEINCEGSREDLMDCCLLRLREQQTNVAHTAQLQKVWSAITGNVSAEDYHSLLAARLKADFFSDETNWLAGCILSGNPDLALYAIDAAGEIKDARIQKAFCSLIRDRNTRPDVRAAAIGTVRSRSDRDGLLAVCDAFGDSTPAYKREYEPIFREDYPFAGRIEVKTLRLMFERDFKTSPTSSKTVGELARAQLKKVAGKDLGPGADKWRNWVMSLKH